MDMDGCSECSSAASCSKPVGKNSRVCAMCLCKVSAIALAKLNIELILPQPSSPSSHQACLKPVLLSMTSGLNCSLCAHFHCRGYVPHMC